MRSATIYFKEVFAGVLTEDEEGYTFSYDPEYLNKKDVKPISLTLPLQQKSFTSKTMIPFFDGLIPEGWLLAIAEKNWKLDNRDRMGLLLACCRDCIGAVSVRGEKD
ncbi:MAG: HipA N-terminal domain-containing protein [Bacteroidota bacterium]